MFLSSAHSFELNFFRKLLSEIPSWSNSLDSDRARHSVGIDLAQTCSQRLSADVTSMYRVIARKENTLKIPPQ